MIATGQESGEAEPDSAGAPVEPFSGGAADSNIDYDALVKELYGSEEEPEATTPTTDVVEEKRRKKHKDRQEAERGMASADGLLHGANLALNVVSPFATSGNLKSWYSEVDYGINLRLPYEVIVESMPLYFDIEISTFSFGNTFPEGGLFEGLAYNIRANAQFNRSGLHAGLGFWEEALGGLLQFEYIFWPGNSLFLKIGTRAVILTDVQPPDVDALGAVWWMDLRMSTGLQF